MCFLFCFFIWFTRFQILICEPRSIWRKLLVLSLLYWFLKNFRGSWVQWWRSSIPYLSYRRQLYPSITKCTKRNYEQSRHSHAGRHGGNYGHPGSQKLLPFQVRIRIEIVFCCHNCSGILWEYFFSSLIWFFPECWGGKKGWQGILIFSCLLFERNLQYHKILIEKTNPSIYFAWPWPIIDFLIRFFCIA